MFFTEVISGREHLVLLVLWLGNIPLSGALSGLTAASSVTVSDSSSSKSHWFKGWKPSSSLVSKSFIRSCSQEDMEDHRLEQANSYKCLRMQFHDSYTVRARFWFLFTKGGKFVPAAPQAFIAKAENQILYGASISFPGLRFSLEGIQFFFLRAVVITASTVLLVLPWTWKLDLSH